MFPKYYRMCIILCTIMIVKKYDNNFNILRSNCIVVYLKSTLDKNKYIIKRLSTDKYTNGAVNFTKTFEVLPQKSTPHYVLLS